jgi:signal transduction histidine kinase
LEGRGQPDESGGQEPPTGGDGTSPPIFQPVQGPSDASTVYVNRDLLIIDHDGNLGSHLLSEADIERAMQSRSAYCCSSHTYRHQTYLVYSAPLIVHGDVRGAVQISISEHQLQQAMNGLLQSLLVVGLLGIIGSGAISVALAGRALQPIRLAMQRQRDFVADAAHELRTPLAIQRTVAEVELPEPTVEDLQSTVAQMLGENRHLTRLVEDLSLLARADTDAIGIERQPVDLSSLLARTSEEIGYLANDRGVALKADVQGSVTVIGDVVRLRQLILILLDNAMKHTPVGGTIAVSLSTEGNRAVVRVADTGAGIAPADLPRVFDRFYRSDQARVGEGTGLGLAIAQWIVGAHGGHISAGNAVPNGAIFTVTLPQARGPAGA